MPPGNYSLPNTPMSWTKEGVERRVTKEYDVFKSNTYGAEALEQLRKTGFQDFLEAEDKYIGHYRGIDFNLGNSIAEIDIEEELEPEEEGETKILVPR